MASQSLHGRIRKGCDINTPCSREAAEIALKEYQEASSPRKEVLRVRDQTGPGRSWKRRSSHPASQGTVRRFKQVKTGSAADLARGWQFEVGETSAQASEKISPVRARTGPVKVKSARRITKT